MRDFAIREEERGAKRIRIKNKSISHISKSQKKSCKANKTDSLSKLRWHFLFPVNYSFNYTASCDSFIPNKVDTVGHQS